MPPTLLWLLFVPFLTDTQNGFSRVRHCAQARAIENECYVAIAGSVGNLPKVQNMDIQFAQSMVFTPCDFAFPTNGVKAEATQNSEMILIADVDIDLLRELNQFGSVRNLKDRRLDLFELRNKGPKDRRVFVACSSKDKGAWKTFWEKHSGGEKYPKTCRVKDCDRTATCTGHMYMRSEWEAGERKNNYLVPICSHHNSIKYDAPNFVEAKKTTVAVKILENNLE